MREDGIVHLLCGDETHAKGIVYGERDALEARGLAENLASEHNEMFMLVDIRKLKKTAPATLYVPPPPKTSRLAIIVGSPVSRMLGNAYMGFRAPACPTRLFTEEHPAIRWLRSAMNTK